jgi:superfamily II DNA helicase RecQ
MHSDHILNIWTKNNMPYAATAIVPALSTHLLVVRVTKMKHGKAIVYCKSKLPTEKIINNLQKKTN